MRIAIMQPYLFPYIGYFQLINAVDKFVLLDDVNFINKGWINRNKLLINGKSCYFTVPLEKASQNKLIKDILIASDANWKGKLLKSIELAYKKAPHFGQIYTLVEKIIYSNYKTISELVHQSIS
ncbi:MAG: WbqC family protein, partial [Bacteroidota bacterium]|nr:WbqC family protein [Bacteroidota bacterium]